MNKDEEIFKIQYPDWRIQNSSDRCPKDEEIYRKAEKLVVRFLDEYQKLYSQRATEEILILVAFRLAVALSKQEVDQDLAPLAEKIKSLDEELKHLLVKNKIRLSITLSRISLVIKHLNQQY